MFQFPFKKTCNIRASESLHDVTPVKTSNIRASNFFWGASNFSNILAPRVSEYKSLMSRPELQLQWLSFNVFNVVLCSSLHITSEGREDKFPLIGYDYQLRDVEDLYIAGGASHGPDYRKSAGGFIHGFRYTGEGLTDRGHIQGALHGLWSHSD